MRIFTQTLGREWRGSYGSAPCPVCQPERRNDQRALSIRSDGRRLLTFCHKTGCDFRAVTLAAGISAAGGAIDRQAAQAADMKRTAYEAEQKAKARKLWEAGKPISGTKGEAYLRGRGITCPLPTSLHWVADTFHGPSARWVSAMVANVTTGGVHRTFFQKNGVRIDRNAKMMQGPCAGGGVALSEADGPLVVCEGIETGLSLLSGLLDSPATVWAALSTSGLRGLQLPPQPGQLTVAVDGDEPGRAAGHALAERAHALGWRVSILDPGNGADFNDVLTGKVVAA
jgi:hypothetical protein